MAHASEYYQYLPSANSIPARLAAYQRRRIFQQFVTTFGSSPEQTILDVGVTVNETYTMDNYLEVLYPHKRSITAVGMEDGSHLEKKYPGMKFIRVEPGPLPFRNGEFEVVHSSAVIEHVGTHENQSEFLREIWRVARKGIFITTPNRWFPIEFHTVLPLVHWLPPAIFRAVLRKIGRDFYADEANLHLMSVRDLRSIADEIGIANAQVTNMYLGPWPSNLILVAVKPGLHRAE